MRDALDKQSYAINYIAEHYIQKNLLELKKLHTERIAKCKFLETTFAQMGISSEPVEINLDRACLWIPASIKHETGDRHARTVYGGVQINGHIGPLSGNQVLNNAAMTNVQHGSRVCRAWGGDADPNGRYWTTENPMTIPNYRNAAGLPNSNTGTGLSMGNIVDPNFRATTFPARPLDGNQGGLAEVRIPNSAQQVRLTFASWGPNPLF
jgi:hypothetical protein